MIEKNIKIIKELPIWEGKVQIESLDGGLTNSNYLVTDNKKN